MLIHVPDCPMLQCCTEFEHKDHSMCYMKEQNPVLDTTQVKVSAYHEITILRTASIIGEGTAEEASIHL